MQVPGIPPKHWIEVATKCAAGVASASLGRELHVVGETTANHHDGRCGSLVSLVSGSNVTYIAVAATPGGCRELAGAMLGLDAADSEDLSHDDIRDSIGELVNIVAGAIKSEMLSEDPGLTLGLPLFIDGNYESDRRAETVSVVCDVGGVECIVSVVVGAAAHCSAA